MKKFLLLSYLFVSFNLAAQTPYLVQDINQEGEPSHPRGFVTIGSVTYFYADDGIHGRELWRTDGTSDGTYLVKDINPGPNHSFFDDDYDQYTVLIPVGEKLFIVADDGSHHYELWVSDGTEAGTTLVKDINPQGTGVGGTEQFVAFNGKLFFSTSESYSRELWVSDGTEAGTQMVEGENAVNVGSESPELLTVYDGKLYFKAINQSNGNPQLWRYDGISTSMVYDIEPLEIATSGNKLFFVADNETKGSELWLTDGTPEGTISIKHISQGTFGSGRISELTNAAGTLFFVHQNDELWRSDGTTNGTFKVKELQGPLFDLVSIDNILYFLGYGGLGSYYVWKSDGTEAGTVIIDEDSDYLDITNLATAGTTLYFKDYSGLWKSDGTAEGTILLKNTQYDFIYRSRSADNNGVLIFTASDEKHAREIWKSDGTEAGTFMIKDINQQGSGTYFSPLTANGNRIAFNASGQQDQLWFTDGNQASAVNPSFSLSRYHEKNMVSINGTLYLAATDYSVSYQSELYKIALDDNSPVLIKDINGDRSSRPESLTEVDGTLFFVAEEEDSQVLWKSDGTESGTVRIKNIDPTNDRRANFQDVDKKLFFVANDSQYGDELWVSDGTETGTHMVKDIRTGVDDKGNPADSDPIYLTSFQDKVFFRAFDGISNELWKSDGTEAGTVKLTATDVSPKQLVTVGNHLFFVGYNADGEEVIWQTDGTETGTSIIKNVLEGGYESYDLLTKGDNQFYFTVDGDALWKSDGTTEGTILVKDINPNGNSELQSLYYTHDQLYFSANDGIHGQELWTSDGTSEGTHLVNDIFPGALGSSPNNIIALDDKLIFNATDNQGQELWAYDITEATISKASQTIAFVGPADLLIGDTITLNATASSGLPVSFSVEGPATLTNNTLIVVGEGEVVVTASQVGNDDFAPAEDVVHRFQASAPEPEVIAEVPASEEVVTGIDAETTKAIVAYPNPTKGYLTLEISDLSWQGSFVYVTTTTGHQLFRTRTNASQLVIDLNPYPAGLYIIAIERNMEVRTLKVAKY